MENITLTDVHAAAVAHGMSPINALTAMQSVAAKSGDSALLDRLCELKSQLIGLQMSAGQLPRDRLSPLI